MRAGRSGLLLTVAFMILVDVSLGWSSSSVYEKCSLTSRRDVFNVAVVGLLGGMSTVLINPEVSKADVTNKVASSPALRSLKRAQNYLPKLLPNVQSNDYVAVKAFLRTPPFDEVRKNGYILVRGGEDSPKASELEASYKSFIASMEKIDGTASLGMRGRSIRQLQMSEEYDNIVVAMEYFIKVRSHCCCSLGLSLLDQ
jgi:hypothetical protein